MTAIQPAFFQRQSAGQRDSAHRANFSATQNRTFKKLSNAPKKSRSYQKDLTLGL